MNPTLITNKIELTPVQMAWLRRRGISPGDIIQALLVWMKDEETKGLKDQPLEASIDQLKAMSYEVSS